MELSEFVLTDTKGRNALDIVYYAECERYDRERRAFLEKAALCAAENLPQVRRVLVLCRQRRILPRVPGPNSLSGDIGARETMRGAA